MEAGFLSVSILGKIKLKVELSKTFGFYDGENRQSIRCIEELIK
jgi:hypothetical protein